MALLEVRRLRGRGFYWGCRRAFVKASQGDDWSVSLIAGSLTTAGMLEELNKTYDTRILISEYTYGRPSVQETVLCRLIDYAVVEEDEDEDDSKGDGER